MSRPLRVLLIEDDEDDYVLIRRLLAEIPDSVLKADLEWVAIYDAALEKVDRCVHDVYLLDYRLGDRSGLDLLREVNERGCRAPVIVLTGQGDYEVDVEAMRAGAADYLVKDRMTAPLLERSIRYALEHAQAEKELLRTRDELERRVQERTAELAIANAQLRKSSEKIKLFAYSVSHDLKSPVMSIHALANRLHDHYAEALGSKGKECCEQIVKASRQIVSIIEKTNLYIAVKETPIQVESIRLKDLLQVIRGEFSQQIESRGILWSEPEADPILRVDSLSLIRVLRNLVENAFKYGGDSLGEVKIEYNETEKHHVLSVKDDGVGIQESDTKKIFGLFKRKRSSRGIEGAGLGLAIVKEIAAQHQGKAWVEHCGKRGTAFYMSISKEL
jgi:signal transduction histidine kinase